jgi:hypothetical protein
MAQAQTVVLDSTNLDAIIKDATGEGLTPAALPKDSGVTATIEAAKADLAPAAAIDPATDDTEGDDGLTPRQKRELTTKMQLAIGKKHRQAREAEEFATEQYNTRRLAEQRAEALQRENEQLKAAIPQPKVEEPKEPQRANFQTDAEYQSALIDWKVDQRLAAQREADRKAAEEKRQAEILATAKSRMAKALELVPDYVEVTENIDWPTPPAIANYMQESEMFAELGYYLAQHAEVREKLESLHWTRQLVEIGKIESKLQPFAASLSPKVTNGKDEKSDTESPNGVTPSPETGENPSPRSAPVIRPLSQSGASQVDKPESEMDAKEALRAWQKKKHVNLTRRSRH